MNPEVMMRVGESLRNLKTEGGRQGKIVVVGGRPSNFSPTVRGYGGFDFWDDAGGVGSSLEGKSGLPADTKFVLFTRFVKHGEFYRLREWAKTVDAQVVGPWNTGQLRRVLKAAMPQEVLIVAKSHHTGLREWMKTRINWKAPSMVEEAKRLWEAGGKERSKSVAALQAGIYGLKRRMLKEAEKNGVPPAVKPTAKTAAAPPAVGAAIEDLFRRLREARAAVEMALEELKGILGE